MENKLTDVIDLLEYLNYRNVVKDYLIRDNFIDVNETEIKILVKDEIVLKLNDAYWYLKGLLDAQDLNRIS